MEEVYIVEAYRTAVGKSKKGALRQARAAYASGYKNKNKKKK